MGGVLHDIRNANLLTHYRISFVPATTKLLTTEAVTKIIHINIEYES